MPSNRILFCTTCNPQPEQAGESEPGRDFGQQVKHALRAAELGGKFDVDYVACMGACTQPVAMALQGGGRATYLFSGLDPATDIGDILATCRAYLDSPDGWIENALPCGRLRHCLTARIPAFVPD